MKQKEAVILTLEKLGGLATLEQLNNNVFYIEDCTWNTKTPFASIRRIVQTTKEIYKIKPGLYALESHRHKLEANGVLVQTEKNKNTDVIKQFNHSYYQGMLVTIGNLKGLSTFVPNQDKNKLFINQKLGEIRSLQSLPRFSYDYFVKKCSTIDVTWINNNGMPCNLFEVEHSTDIQNSLLKYASLTDFSSSMMIVADSVRLKEYHRKLEIVEKLINKNRVQFLSYENLEKIYNAEMLRKSCSIVL